MKKNFLILESPLWKKGDIDGEIVAKAVLEKLVSDVVLSANRIRMFDVAKWAMTGAEFPEIPDPLPLKFNVSFEFIEPLVSVEDAENGVARLMPNPEYRDARYSLKFHSPRGYDQIQFDRDNRVTPIAPGMERIVTHLYFDDPQLLPVQFVIVDHKPETPAP